MLNIWRGARKGTRSRPKLIDFLTVTATFLAVALLATTGLVEGIGRPAHAGPGGSYFAEGVVEGSNPSTVAVSGVTESELQFFCDYPPDSQGADAYIFKLPDDFALPAPATLTGTSAGPYDLNAYFYDAECALIDDFNMATGEPDESGTIPAGTVYVAAAQFAGANTTATLCAGDPAGCVAGSPSGSPSGSPTTDPGPQGRQRISIQTDSSVSRYRDRFTLSGQVDGDVECGPPQSHRVGVSKKVLGSKGDYKSLDRSLPVRPNGKWSLNVRSGKSARYRATVSPSRSCPPASAGPLIIRVRTKLKPLVSNDQGGCGPKKFFGRLKPSYPGTTVKLQRHTQKGKWKGFGESGRVNKKGQFAVKAPECGLYRAIWPKQAPSNIWGFAKFRHGKR